MDYHKIPSLGFTFDLIDSAGHLVSSAIDALRGSAAGYLAVSPYIGQKQFSFVFYIEDNVICRQWQIIGFKICVVGAKSYAVRVGDIVSKTYSVSRNICVQYSFFRQKFYLCYVFYAEM